MYDNMYELKKTCTKLEKEHMNKIKFHFFTAYDIDEKIEEFEKLKKITEKSKLYICYFMVGFLILKNF